MPFRPDELAQRLLNRPVTPERVRKLRRHIRDEAHRDATLEAIAQHPIGGDTVSAQVEELLTQGRRNR